MAPPAAPPVQEQPSGKQLSYQLAAAVRSINWTYAIFWSISTSLRPPGVLKWKDGFYNGEVKTRKIISSTTTGLTANDLVLQRSEQLRELYESLLSGKVDHRARRPAAALSPEDLGEAEWYYTLSMTYAFRPGQGLPGKSFVSNQHVWLHNAQYTDTKTFQRALLAKTAPIQTVVCIPFMGGVLELGTSDLVLEDPDMVNRIGTSFWELPFPTCSDTKQPSSSPSTNESGGGEVDVVVLQDLDHNNVVEGMISELGEVECMYDVNFERATKEVDEFYGLIAEMDMCALEDNWVMDRSFEFMSSPEMLPAVDAPSTVDHVIVTLSSIVKGSHTSCFTGWKRSSDWEDMDARVFGESQKLLKKVVAGGAWTTRAQESNIKTHVLSERRRREKINEMFLVLKSLVPSINKMDKASILAETISYLKELEQRVEKLESDRASTPTRSIETTGRRLCDINIGKKIKVSARSKRKAPELEMQDDGPSNVVNVTMMDKEVLLEVKCRWKELMMTRVFDAIKSLRLDVVSVQASTPGGLLDLKIRASQQFAAGSATVSPGKITEVLQKAIGNS